MGRTLALRKCGDHEDCQLQSLNGGEWQHTPAKRSVAARLNLNEQEQERLAAQLNSQLATANTLAHTLQERIALADALRADLDPSTRERLEAELAGEVGEVTAMRVRMGEQLARAEARLAHLEESVQGLPVVRRLHDEARRLGEELKAEQSELRTNSNRLERDLDRLSRFTSKLEAAVQTSKQQSERATRDALAAAETATHLGERLPRIDGTLSRSDDLIGKLSRLDEVLEAVREVGQRQADDMAALRSDLQEAFRLINKERDERIAGHLKVQRQLRGVASHG